MAKQSAKEIDEAAALWVARLDRGLSAEEDLALQAWLADDIRRLGAFARMRALSARTERSAGLGQDYRPERFRPPSAPWLTRRRMIQSGAAGGAVAAAAAGTALWLAGANGRYQTRKGEVRVVALGDGSVVTLNTASTLAVRYSRTQRLIKLLEGEALFDVAKDAARPFLVAAGDLNVRAVGTSFTVRRLSGAPVQVLVQEGVVELRKTSLATQPVRLSANMRAVGGQALTGAAVQPSEVKRELIWREGRIEFEGESLADASAEFARYSDTRIVIDDPELARLEISGSFQSNDPVGFGRAVAEAFRARVQVGDGEVRLLR
ncbi:MAG TPA: FecR domain-containing protein [Caulobacteraceae bacterium]|nr:FecR domain-containing protein [Caulobacteraceae bacterium]